MRRGFWRWYISPDPAKTEAVQKMEPPVDIAGVCMGMMKQGHASPVSKTRSLEAGSAFMGASSVSTF